MSNFAEALDKIKELETTIAAKDVIIKQWQKLSERTGEILLKNTDRLAELVDLENDLGYTLAQAEAYSEYLENVIDQALEKQIDEVIVWAESKGIFANSTPTAQMTKMQEEVQELMHEVAYEDSTGRGDPYAIQDELGDVLVTVIVQAHMQDLLLGDCLQIALNKIRKRTGKMVDGVFVKDTEQAVRELSELTGEY